MNPNNPLITTHTGQIFLSQQPTPSTVSGRREYECRFTAAGRVKRADQTESNWLIPAAILEASVPLFESCPCYLDHPELFGFGWHQTPLVRHLAGITFDPTWSEEEQAIMGKLRLYDEHPSSPGGFLGILLDQILEDKEKGLAVPPLGLSAVFFQSTHLDEDTGLSVTDAISHVESVDIVYDAGAKGYIDKAIAELSAQPTGRIWTGLTSLSPQQGVTTMTAEELAALAAAQAAQEAAPAAPASQTPPPPVTVTPPPPPATIPSAARLQSIEDSITALTELVTAQAADNTIQDNGRAHTLLTGGREGLEQIQLATEAMFAGVRPPDGVRPLTGIRELYTLLSGDYELTGLFHDDRVYLANVTSTTMANIVANVLNKRVMNLWQTYPKWWEGGVTEQDFASLQQIRWITLGGVGELPTVGEGQAYTELTWDDLAQRSSFEKKGGYLGITLESIDKDDTAKVVAAPRVLTQAAWLTLGRSISEIFTANTDVGPNVYYDDSNQRALFHTSNLNLGSTAFSPAAWKATKIAMMKQPEHHSSERLGALLRPEKAWCPMDLEDYATTVLASDLVADDANNNVNVDAEGDTRSARLARARSRVISVPFWTNTANWAAQANTLLYPTIGIGYRYGRMPEIFSVADPKAGLMFTNDTMPVKVRFFYATGPIDYRGLYKHNV